jgi:Na+/proline symporter
VALYLVFMLIIGFYTSRRPITTLRDYALGTGGLGTGGYSLLALVGTLVATDFGAGATLGDASKVFQLGLGFLIIKLMLPIKYWVIADVVVPRMKSFIEHTSSNEKGILSVGDIMFHYYGKPGQLLSGLLGFVVCVGIMGAQISGIGWLLHYSFGWDYTLGIGLGFGVVVAYTTAGGIRAVVRTDVFQTLFCFIGIAICAILSLSNLAQYYDYEYWIACLLGLGSFTFLIAAFDASWVRGKHLKKLIFAYCLVPLGVYIFAGRGSPLEHIKQLMQLGRLFDMFKYLPEGHRSFLPLSMNAAEYLFTMIMMTFPLLNPVFVQRILMGGNVADARSSFRICAGFQLILCLMVISAGLAACIQFPEAEPSSVLLKVLESSAGPILLGICLVGLLAAIMSTADSYLNAASICFSHDITKSILGNKLSQAGELRLARLSSFVIGILAAYIAIDCKDIRNLLIASAGAWGPAIVIPLWAGILGYRASSRVFILAALAGGVTAWVLPAWLPPSLKLSCTVPAMLANGLAFWAARKWEQGQKPPAGPRRGPNIAGKAGIAARTSIPHGAPGIG